MGKLIDLVGERFGTLTVLAFDHSDSFRNTYWLCRCDCGEVCVKNGHSLRRGHTTTCGTQNHRINEYIVDGDIAYCVLYNTGNKVIFDSADISKVRPYRWFEDAGYAIAWNNGNRIKMHRLIIDAPSGMFADHINHDTLDNRRKNLRIVTIGQNNMNRKPKNDVSGVSWCKSANKWRAVISIHGRPKHIGLFTNRDDAVKARMTAEQKYYGEYSYHADEQMNNTPWEERDNGENAE